MVNELTLHQQEIQQWIWRLDEVSIEYEARWGIDRLPNLVSPAMTVKWNAQIRKLDEAVANNDLMLVRELAAGTIRGWKKLEDEAVSLGATKNNPETWDVRHPESGKHYRICKTLNDARLWANQPDVVVYTLEEVARILETKQLTVMNPTKVAYKGDKPEPFDFTKGDKITL